MIDKESNYRTGDYSKSILQMWIKYPEIPENIKKAINFILGAYYILFLHAEFSIFWLRLCMIFILARAAISILTQLKLIKDNEIIDYFFIQLEIINFICIFIPMLIYKLSTLSQTVVMDTYVPLHNLITFFVYLVFIIYQRIRIGNKKVMYYIFFLVYCTSVIFNFMPIDFQQAILNIVFTKGDFYAGIGYESLFFPAIKEAMLSFIILDVAIESNEENR